MFIHRKLRMDKQSLKRIMTVNRHIWHIAKSQQVVCQPRYLKIPSISLCCPQCRSTLSVCPITTVKSGSPSENIVIKKKKNSAKYAWPCIPYSPGRILLLSLTRCGFEKILANLFCQIVVSINNERHNANESAIKTNSSIQWLSKSTRNTLVWQWIIHDFEDGDRTAISLKRVKDYRRVCCYLMTTEAMQQGKTAKMASASSIGNNRSGLDAYRLLPFLAKKFIIYWPTAAVNIIIIEFIDNLKHELRVADRLNVSLRVLLLYHVRNCDVTSTSPRNIKRDIFLSSIL